MQEITNQNLFIKSLQILLKEFYMVKAFIVTFKPIVVNQYSIGGGTISYSCTPNYPDNRCIVVIANSITDIGCKYPQAISITEYDAKDVVILDKVICPVKEDCKHD